MLTHIHPTNKKAPAHYREGSLLVISGGVKLPG